MLFRHRSLAWRGLVPALIVLVVAVVITLLDHEYGDGDDVIRRYYAIATAAASIPSVVFANSYARLAAEAHARLGFGERSPLLTRLWSRLVHAARAAILISIAIAPLLPILRRVPAGGDALIFAATGMWTLHWIVVEALDNARVAGAAVAPSGTPWFVAWAVAPAVQRIPVVRRPLGWFARLVTRLSRPWLEETALVARHPAIALGMGATAALLLAVPIANLLLRPAILIGAVHLRARWSESS